MYMYMHVHACTMVLYPLLYIHVCACMYNGTLPACIGHVHTCILPPLTHPHRCVPLVEQERYVELVGRVRADKREAERLREAAKKNMEETEVRKIIK